MEDNKLDIPIRGELRGTAEVRDKDGNLKCSFTFGGETTSDVAAQVAGKSQEHVENNLGSNLVGEK